MSLDSTDLNKRMYIRKLVSKLKLQRSENCLANYVKEKGV